MRLTKTSPPKVILVAGLVAGTLDILSAFTHAYLVNPKNGPMVILHYIASAVMGKEAYSGGMGTAAVGLLFHYIIATSFAALFVILYLNVKFIRKNTIVVGLLYGIFAWAVMSYVVLPMTKIPQRPFVLKNAVIAILILMFALGLSIALITKSYFKRKFL